MSGSLLFAATILRIADMERGRVKQIGAYRKEEQSGCQRIAMAKDKKPRAKPESGPTGTDEQAETKAIENWPRGVDRPLAKEKEDTEDTVPRGE